MTSRLTDSDRSKAQHEVAIFSRVLGFAFYMTSSIRHINLPYRLAKKYRSDKPLWDLLCLAVCMKLNSKDSGLVVRRPQDMMNVFHCSYRKARRLMVQAIGCTDLFRYNPKSGFLVARTFKSGCKIFNSQKGNVYYGDDCIIVTIPSDGRISHYQISQWLRDAIIQKALKNEASSDKSTCQNLYSERRKPLTQEYIGNIAGYHQTTVSRHLRKMGRNGAISIDSHDRIAVYDLEHGEVINEMPGRKPFVCGRMAYVRDVNDYSIIDTTILCKFRHVIYNNKRRVEPKQSRILWPWEL